MNVIVTEKFEDGSLREIDRRDWTQDMLLSLNSANYVLIHNKEYEMIEGRLNVDLGAMELLVTAAKQE